MKYLFWLFFSFDGRIARQTYFLASLAIFFTTFALGLYLAIFTSIRIETIEEIIELMIMTVPLQWVWFAVATKRAHDRGIGGFEIVTEMFNPFRFERWANLTVPGDRGENMYGLPPAGTDSKEKPKSWASQRVAKTQKQRIPKTETSVTLSPKSASFGKRD